MQYNKIQLVEALEVMILSILSAALKCEWNLSSVQEAAITTVTILIKLSLHIIIMYRLCFLDFSLVIQCGAHWLTNLGGKRY